MRTIRRIIFNGNQKALIGENSNYFDEDGKNIALLDFEH